MSDYVKVKINGEPVSVSPLTVVATAIASEGITRFRRSVTGKPRTALCGMGVCFECRVTINGQPNIRSCQVLCEDGMEIVTDD
ncbi:MAG: (2Fe-2S)-binding protein [Phycisphaerae bacterium]|nr:(2Fe-2S)-binding protein [Phycisphaerae bacterium]